MLPTMTMQAVVLTGYGNTDRLQLRSVPRPTPAPNEVLVRVRATGVNDWDYNILRGIPLTRLGEGLFRPRKKILGLDVAGEVVEVGSEVTKFSPGDRVFGDLSSAGFGGFAEYVSPVDDALTLLPDSISFVDAAALSHAGNLAAQAIELAGLQPQHRLLINGAGGGVGTLAVQLATELGVTDIVGVDAASKLDLLRELGFARALDYREVDFARMASEGGDEKFDVVIDARSTRSPAECAEALTDGGSYVTVGGQTRRVLSIGLSRERTLKNTGKTVALVMLKPNADNERLLELVGSGALSPRIDSLWPLAETRQAMERFASGKHRGKIVVSVDG